MPAELPSLQAPAVDQTGRFSQAWVGFFTRFVAKPAPIVAVPLAGSPTHFTAPSSGSVAVSGGSGISLNLTRARAGITVTGGIIPVAQGDVLSVTYSGAPTLSFIPAQRP